MYIVCKCKNGYTPFNKNGNCRFCFGINPVIKKIQYCYK